MKRLKRYLFFIIFIFYNFSFATTHKIYITENGLYKINYKELGLKEKLNIKNKGKDIPFLKNNEFIVFYGKEANSEFTYQNVYFIDEGERKEEVESINQLLPDEEIITKRFEENKIYDDYQECFLKYKTTKLHLDYWLWDEIKFNTKKEVVFDIDNFDNKKESTIRIVLQSSCLDEKGVRIIFLLNNKRIGEAKFCYLPRLIFEKKINGDYLKEGKNRLTIIVKSKDKKKKGSIYLNYIELIYNRINKKIIYKKPYKIIKDEVSNLKTIEEQFDYIIISLPKFFDTLKELINYRER